MEIVNGYCGGYENAQLRSIGFSRLESMKQQASQPELFLKSRSGTKNYAFALEPGKYALTDIKIKVARSMKEVGYLTLDRTSLVQDDQSKGGFFEIEKGMVAYIGHFGLDCTFQPLLWRYYLETESDFDDYIEVFMKKHKYLSDLEVDYKLFQTNEFGHDYQIDTTQK